jgi:hypothetical protein
MKNARTPRIPRIWRGHIKSIETRSIASARPKRKLATRCGKRERVGNASFASSETTAADSLEHSEKNYESSTARNAAP